MIGAIVLAYFEIVDIATTSDAPAIPYQIAVLLVDGSAGLIGLVRCHEDVSRSNSILCCVDE